MDKALLVKIVEKALTFNYGGMSKAELLEVGKLSYLKKVLELGSMVGMSSFVIGSFCERLDCVDVWKDNQDHLSHDPLQAGVYAALTDALPNMHDAFVKNCKELLYHGIITMHQGRTTELASTFPNKEYDVILIDADHSYQGVSSDFYAYESKLKDDGIFVFHDWGDSMWFGIKQFADEMVTQKRLEYVSSVERIGVFKKPNG